MRLWAMNVLQICIAIQIPIALCDFDRHDKLDSLKVCQMNEKSYLDCNGAASKTLDCCLVTVRIYLVYFKIRCNLKSVIVKYRSLGDCKAFHSCYDKVHIF